MDRHPYKYLAKTIHRIFFPVFALLENKDAEVGKKAVAQRKLLFLEKVFAAMLLGYPRIRDQLKTRLSEMEGHELRQDQAVDVAADQELWSRRRTLLQVLRALHLLMSFFLPALFRIGWLVRCCTWEGREANSSAGCRHILEEIMVLLMHLLGDSGAKNEYVRTISVTLLTWQPWNNKLPAVVFMEESCEALLSRMSHRCSSHRHLRGFEATFDLYATLPPPKRGLKASRGMLREGLVQEFVQRLRWLIQSDGSLPYAATVGANTMHSLFFKIFPVDVLPRKVLPRSGEAALFEEALRKALMCLTGKTKVSEAVQEWMKANVSEKSPEDLQSFNRAMEVQKKWFDNRKPRDRKRAAAPSKPPAKPPKKFMPKPRARSTPTVFHNIVTFCVNFNEVVAIATTFFKK